MVVKWLISCLILLFGLAISYAQKLTNVSVRQEQSSIIVTYNIVTKTPCKIALYVSMNGGTTWQGPLKKVLGDIGANVSSGNKSITWNVLEEFEELRGDNIKFQVQTEDTSYETVKIGNQVWMKKNLDVSTYRNGDIIPEVKGPDEWGKLTTGAWCYYNNDPKNGEIYGKLYNWYAVNDPRGLAPNGYHVPSNVEWGVLTKYLGGKLIAGSRLKLSGSFHWTNPNSVKLNISNYSAIPAGYRNLNGLSSFIGTDCYWWTSTSFEKNFSWCMSISNFSDSFESIFFGRVNGFSVRCIKD